MLKQKLSEITFIGFDTETSGKYPLDAEICEIAAVKYQNGQIIDEYQTLVRTRRPMSHEVINIHGITNEMVKGEKVIEDVIAGFHDFIQGGILVAHHAPFDLGFISIEFEKNQLPFPDVPTICSSKLSRNVIKDAPNHKLQTLIPHLGIKQGRAHRALDDAKACLDLALICFERGQLNTLDAILTEQGGPLYWKDFSMQALKKEERYDILLEAIEDKRRVMLAYGSGPKPGRERLLEPIGLVRSPDGDFLVANDGQPHPKRFYFNKIQKVFWP